MSFILNEIKEGCAPTGEAKNAMDSNMFYKFREQPNAIKNPISEAIKRTQQAMVALKHELGTVKPLDSKSVIFNIPVLESMDACMFRQIQYFLSVFECVIWPTPFTGVHNPLFDGLLKTEIIPCLRILINNLRLRTAQNDDPKALRDPAFFANHPLGLEFGPEDAGVNGREDAFLKEYAKTKVCKANVAGINCTFGATFFHLLNLTDESEGVPDSLWGILLRNDMVPDEFFATPFVYDFFTRMDTTSEDAETDNPISFANRDLFMRAMCRSWDRSGITRPFIFDGCGESKVITPAFGHAANMLHAWLTTFKREDDESDKLDVMSHMKMLPEEHVAIFIALSRMNKSLFKTLFRFFDLWEMRDKGPRVNDALKVAVRANGEKLNGEEVYAIHKLSTVQAIARYHRTKHDDGASSLSDLKMDRFYASADHWTAPPEEEKKKKNSKEEKKETKKSKPALKRQADDEEPVEEKAPAKKKAKKKVIIDEEQNDEVVVAAQEKSELDDTLAMIDGDLAELEKPIDLTGEDAEVPTEEMVETAMEILADEAQAEPAAAVEEPAAEEPAAEEAPVEEPAAEEAPVEELATAEDIPAEEPAAEEAPVEEEPAAEEIAVEEPAAEEPAVDTE